WMTQVNIEIKYALFMEIDEPGIDHSNFHVHRERLIKKQLDVLFLDRFTRLMYYLGVLTGKEPFLTDTTHAIAPISAPTAIELIRQGIRLLLRWVIKHHPDEWEKLTSWPLAARHLSNQKEVKEHHLDEGQKRQRLQEVVKEADALMNFIEEHQGFWMKDPTTVNRALVLCRILNERVLRNPDGSVELAPNRDVKDILVSAVDTEARFGNKGKTKWRGYKIATVEIGNTGFIAAADTTKANGYDGDTLVKLVDQTPVDMAENPKIIGDTHYGSGNNRRQMANLDIELIAPPSEQVKVQKLIKEGFSINPDHTVLTCPNSRTFKKYNDVESGRVFPLSGAKCKSCSRFKQCFGGKRNRHIFINTHFELLSAAEEYAKTEQYREDIKLRARIEAKQNELANAYGLRRVRYMGARKLAFAARMRSLGANFKRLQRILASGEFLRTHLDERLAPLKKSA
ncbi:MAG: transposase, partial [Bacillota bacterium]